MNAKTARVDGQFLSPILADPVLMALIKNRYIPFSFIVKRMHRRISKENAQLTVEALTALIKREHSAVGVGVQDLGVHFAMMAGVLHIGGGRMAQRNGHQLVDEVGDNEIRDSLSADSRLAARNFAAKHYEPLKKQYDLYQKVLRECEHCTNLVDARTRLAVDEPTWQHLKGLMGRFGLVHDVVYAKAILLDGLIVREIEQRAVGQRVEDVVPRLLREALATPA